GESQSGQRKSVLVRALFDKEGARWVRESRSYYTSSEEETPEGLLVTLQPHQESEVLQWLLSWGSHVRVLEPETLRQQIAEEAQGMLRKLVDRTCRFWRISFVVLLKGENDRPEKNNYCIAGGKPCVTYF